MSINYLKVEPEEAVKLLEQQIVVGYQLKDKLEAEYAKYRENVEEHVDAWNALAFEWANTSLKVLQDKIYLSSRQAYNFRDAKTDGLMRSGVNSKFENIIKHMQARIDTLNVYTDFIFERAHITITAGRDANIQMGNGNSMEIESKK